MTSEGRRLGVLAFWGLSIRLPVEYVSFKPVVFAMKEPALQALQRLDMSRRENQLLFRRQVRCGAFGSYPRRN